MSPRRYRSDHRRAALDETRRRILQATVQLHAERGVTSTTFAMIAERADVAVPTVYNHFPTRADLIAACTGHISTQAPPLGPQIFQDALDMEARLRALVRALFAYYSYRAPWLRWGVHEAVFVPELASLLERASDGRRQLIALALEPAFGKRTPPGLQALCEVLLDFSAWQQLTTDPSLSSERAEAIVGDALIALVRQHDPSIRCHAARRADLTTTGRRRSS
jgi:AcrR family transcriptional regulator